MDLDGFQAAVLHPQAQLFVNFLDTVSLQAVAHALASVRDGLIATLNAGYFGGTDAEVLWLIIGAPEELELLQGSKSRLNLSFIYPVDPKQLPKELAGVEWPPKE